MEFITKREVFHNGKLRDVGATVISNEKLDVIYPKLFVRKGIKIMPGNSQPNKQTVNENKTEDEQ